MCAYIFVVSVNYRGPHVLANMNKTKHETQSFQTSPKFKATIIIITFDTIFRPVFLYHPLLKLCMTNEITRSEL